MLPELLYHRIKVAEKVFNLVAGTHPHDLGHSGSTYYKFEMHRMAFLLRCSRCAIKPSGIHPMTIGVLWKGPHLRFLAFHQNSRKIAAKKIPK